MKRTLSILFLLLPVVCSPAKGPCVATDCNGIKTIDKCPHTGCSHPDQNGHPHYFDEKLDRQKNIESDNHDPHLRTIEWIKNRPVPKSYSKCGNRDSLRQVGEGDKITVVAWALKAETQPAESCNCDLPEEKNRDTHIVLVDPRVKDPTLTKDKSGSVVAEFTPRVRQKKHHHFTANDLKDKIKAAKRKLLVRVTGLLMFDSKHYFEVPNPTSRGTYWEVHPVLKFEYCPTGETCRANSDANWKNL